MSAASLQAQPTITQQPTNQILAIGGTMALSVTTGGATPQGYQWFKDSRRLLGATNRTLTAANAGATNSGTYYVVVTNSIGMVISIPASIAVGNPTLVAWGYNISGELGNGTTISTNQPFNVVGDVVTGAVGYQHSLFVKSDGTLWTMGYNRYGQLGNGAPNDTNKPTFVANNVVAVAGGEFHSLFVKTNGTLWAMGYNRFGQLGNGVSSQTNSTPVSVASDVVMVAAGIHQSLFVKTNGTLWAMGYNFYGQLGNGTTSNTNSTPINITSNVVVVASGSYHSLFIKNDGTLWAMGRNQYGELGNGTTNDVATPFSVASNVVAVAAGEYHTLFVKTDGTLWAVGRNQYGQLGNGTTNDTSTPVNITNNVVAVAAGFYHSLFVMTNGTLWAMGINSLGQLGNGTTGNTNQPVNVPHLLLANAFKGQADHCLAIGINYSAGLTLSNLSQTYTGGAILPAVSTTPAGLTVNLTYNGSSVMPTNAGRYTVIATINDPNYFGSVTNTLVISPVGPVNQTVAVGGTFTLSVSAGAGQAYQWFKDSRLLVGATNSALSVAIARLTNSGTYYAAITNLTGMFITMPASVSVGNPTLLAWGYNGYGQLGNSTANNTNVPIMVASNVVAGAAGINHSLFIKTDGTLWAMGNNGSGQFGIGTYNSSSSPIRVASNVVTVAAGGLYSLYVKTNGTLSVMGNNQYGQLGTGTTISTNLPVTVASNVVLVAAGYTHSLFVTSDGTLWTMGQNQYGQLGSGTNSSYISVPAVVASNVVTIAAGYGHSLFVKTDGTLWAMGGNFDGQLGNGLTSNTNLPVILASNVVSVAAGGYHSLFVKTDGTLWAMGYNPFGQLGIGMTSNTNLPVNVANNVVAIAAGYGHSLFVTGNDGAIWSMGYNSSGQLGIGTTSNTNLPVNLPHFSVASVFPASQAFYSLAIGINTQAVATVTLGNLIQAYSGNAISPTVSTTPPGLTVNLTYNGFSTPPTNIGNYSVDGIIDDPNYQGRSSGTLTILWLTNKINQTADVGGAVRLGVAASPIGSASVFQWFKNSQRISDATNSTLTVSNANMADSGSYYLVATNGGAMFISTPSLVSVGNSTLQTWGYNVSGQLGNGTVNNTNVPVTVASNIVTVGAGGVHTLYVTSDGILSGWGNNNVGELNFGYQTNVVAVAAGFQHSLFVKFDGTLWGIGDNYWSQLGNGGNSSVFTPTLVANSVVTVAAGLDYSVFLKSDGTLWTMGKNIFTPANVASNVVAVSGGELGYLFVTMDGTAWTSATSPVVGVSNVMVAATGIGHSLFVTSDRTLWAIGSNQYGQLGNGTTNDAASPISVASNVVAVAAGTIYSMFVKIDGTLWVMGDNTYGELGNGTNGNYYTLPIMVPRLSAANIFASDVNFQSMSIGIILPLTLNISANSTNHQQLTLQLAGTPNYPYILQTTTNLAPPTGWQAIFTNPADASGNWSFTVTNFLTVPKRFYRALGQ